MHELSFMKKTEIMEHIELEYTNIIYDINDKKDSVDVLKRILFLLIFISDHGKDIPDSCFINYLIASSNLLSVNKKGDDIREDDSVKPDLLMDLMDVFT